MSASVTIVTWVWKGERDYRLEHAAALEETIRRYATFDYRFVAIADPGTPTGDGSFTLDVLTTPKAARRLADLKTPEGGRFPSSYRRLWLFSKEARDVLGPLVVLTDVDAVAVGDWRPLVEWNPAADFVGWQPGMRWGNTERRLAGGMWRLRTGYRPHVYDGFVADPAAAIKRARAAGYRGSDQAWISHCLADTAPVWPKGFGVYSVRDFLERGRRGRVQGRPRVDRLPDDARVVHFNGPVKPWEPRALEKHPWLRGRWPGVR